MTRRAPQGTPSPARGASSVVYPISLCMIARNEERFLADALASVQGVVDEICIADTGSTDATVAIAESFGAKISHIVWRDDFAWARNRALAMASGAWIFVLDADERLTTGSRDEVRALRGVRPEGGGRWIRCRNLSDPVREIVASTNALVRIFPNDPAVRYRGALHEYIARGDEPYSLPSGKTGIEIHHLGYMPEIIASKGKGDRNLRVSAAAVEADPDNPDLVYNYAMSALLAGDRDLGRAQLERVITMIREGPRGFRPMALTMLAGIYLDDGRPADALELADECVKIVATLPDGHFMRGRALTALGRHHEARASLGQAINVGQGGTFEHFVTDDQIPIWKAHNEIGGTLVTEKRYPEARQWLDLALRAQPAERVLMRNRARCYESEGNLAEALAGFRSMFDLLLDEESAIELVNFVFRHGAPDAVLQAVELAMPVLGNDYRRAFLISGAAALLRVNRQVEAGALVGRALAVGEQPEIGRAIVRSLAQQYGMPQLNGLIDGSALGLLAATGGWQ
jgi:tetratricopeptide (TPR) repeat protein